MSSKSVNDRGKQDSLLLISCIDIAYPFPDTNRKSISSCRGCVKNLEGIEQRRRYRDFLLEFVAKKGNFFAEYLFYFLSTATRDDIPIMSFVIPV
jgi:hypothetical protein